MKLKRAMTYCGIAVILAGAAYFLFWNAARVEYNRGSRAQAPATWSPDDLRKEYPFVHSASQFLNMDLYAKDNQISWGRVLGIEITKRWWLGLCIVFAGCSFLCMLSSRAIPALRIGLYLSLILFGGALFTFIRYAFCLFGSK